jgi:hypothetical protein
MGFEADGVWGGRSPGQKCETWQSSLTDWLQEDRVRERLRVIDSWFLAYMAGLVVISED